MLRVITFLLILLINLSRAQDFDNRLRCDPGFIPRNGACEPYHHPRLTHHHSTKKAKPINTLCPSEHEIACPLPHSPSSSTLSVQHGKQRSSAAASSRGRTTSADGYECVDPINDLFNCGGCSALKRGGGQDCSTLPHALGVGCDEGTCEILSCKGGYKISLDRRRCIPGARVHHHGSSGLK
ncbi:hypothetical protein BT69DRAFT_1352501 [Atractiella rhizophila]|nr:hypothetical protein BT69DRAFT_1352501 [Atractiella rhizophila]